MTDCASRHAYADNSTEWTRGARNLTNETGAGAALTLNITGAKVMGRVAQFGVAVK
jgi:hypothetical protein